MCPWRTYQHRADRSSDRGALADVFLALLVTPLSQEGRATALIHGLPPSRFEPFQYTGDVPHRIRMAVETLARSEACVAAHKPAVSHYWAAGVSLYDLALIRRRVAREELRAAMREYAAALRLDHVPPEHMVITLKTGIRRTASPVMAECDIQALTRDVLLWGIEAYYAAA